MEGLDRDALGIPRLDRRHERVPRAVGVVHLAVADDHVRDRRRLVAEPGVERELRAELEAGGAPELGREEAEPARLHGAEEEQPVTRHLEPREPAREPPAHDLAIRERIGLEHDAGLLLRADEPGLARPADPAPLPARVDRADEVLPARARARHAMAPGRLARALDIRRAPAAAGDQQPDHYRQRRGPNRTSHSHSQPAAPTATLLPRLRMSSGVIHTRRRRTLGLDLLHWSTGNAHCKILSHSIRARSDRKASHPRPRTRRRDARAAGRRANGAMKHPSSCGCGAPSGGSQKVPSLGASIIDAARPPGGRLVERCSVALEELLEDSKEGHRALLA